MSKQKEHREGNIRRGRDRKYTSGVEVEGPTGRRKEDEVKYKQQEYRQVGLCGTPRAFWLSL